MLVRRLALVALLVAAPLAPLACRGPELLEPRGQSATLERAGYALAFDTLSDALVLSRGEERLVTLPLDRFSLVSVERVDEGANYDPWPRVVGEPSRLPFAGERVYSVRRPRLLEASDDAMTIALDYGPVEATLEVRAEAEGRFRLALVPRTPEDVVEERVAMLSFVARVEPDEGLYGLGEQFDEVNQRGKKRAMQLEVDGELESSNNEAHVPVPLLIGTGGWGLFVESSLPGAFDVAATVETDVEVTYGTGAASKDGLVFHLLAAEHPLDVTERYYRLTGFPRLPAPWALGPIVWRDENDDQAQVEADLDAMRDLDLPASAIWIDRPYATAVNTFDFEPARFPDPAALVAKARSLGFRVALWHVPYLDDEAPETAVLRAEAEERGFYPLETGLLLNGWGKPIDFTVPEASAWWQGLLAPYVDLGVEGFKLDYAEDVVPGVFGARNVYRFRDGSDERTMHRGYTLAYHATYAELLPEDGGLLLCRAGKWGSQVEGPIIWPGDLDARLWKHRQPVSEGGESFVAVGGLHASMVAGLSLGPSGFPFYGSDTGGYRHAPPDAETFRRWFEQTALSSVMQIGTGSSDVAWELGDEELLDSYRAYTRLHLRLFPYLWTLARDVAVTGRPIQRPFGLAEPSLGVHPSDQYFLGDALLVAPVTEAGVNSRVVVLPPGRWVSFWDGGELLGPGEVTVPAPLGTIPLLLRAGSPLPMLRPTIDSLAPTTEPERVDSFATTAGPLFVRLAPGPESVRSLYDGATIHASEGETDVRVELSDGEVFRHGTVLEIVAWGDVAPSAVTIDGDPIPEGPPELDPDSPSWRFEPDALGGRVLVSARSGKHAVRIVR